MSALRTIARNRERLLRRDARKRMREEQRADRTLRPEEEQLLRLATEAESAGARIPVKTAIDVAALRAVPVIGRRVAFARAAEVHDAISAAEASEAAS